MLSFKHCTVCVPEKSKPGDGLSSKIPHLLQRWWLCGLAAEYAALSGRAYSKTVETYLTWLTSLCFLPESVAHPGLGRLGDPFSKFGLQLPIFQFEASAVNIGVEVSEDCKNGCVPWPEPEVNGHESLTLLLSLDRHSWVWMCHEATWLAM